MKALKKITASILAFGLILASVSAIAYNDVPEDYPYGEAIAFNSCRVCGHVRGGV